MVRSMLLQPVNETGKVREDGEWEIPLSLDEDSEGFVEGSHGGICIT